MNQYHLFLSSSGTAVEYRISNRIFLTVEIVIEITEAFPVSNRIDTVVIVWHSFLFFVRRH